MSEKRAGVVATDYAALNDMRREASNHHCADCGKEGIAFCFSFPREHHAIFIFYIISLYCYLYEFL